MRIFLIGFMASGKSYWGKQLAQKLNLPFIDLDILIEQNTKHSISEIFKEKGEAEFRKLESSTLKQTISKKDNFVMACGGGIMLSEANHQVLKSNGITVFVDTPIQTIIDRLLTDGTTRPLLAKLSKTDLNIKVKTMFEARRNAYETASINFYPAYESLNDLIQKL